MNQTDTDIGFKDTKVGSIPSDWECIPFEDIIIPNGLSYGIVQPGFHQVNNSVPVLRVNNIKDGRILAGDVMMVDVDIEKKYSRTRLKGGELVLTVVGSVGECAIVKSDYAGWNVARAVSVSNISDLFDKSFIKYCFSFEPVKYQMYSHTNDTVQPTLNLSALKQLFLPIPPLPEQKSIASILSSLDEKIDLLNRQNKTLEAVAQTLFRQWFVEEAEEGWDEKGLDEIADFMNGLPCQKYRPIAGVESFPVIKIKELRQGVTEASDSANSEVPEKYIINDGDILFSWSGSLEVVIWSYDKGILNQHLFKVTSANYPEWFFYFWIKHHLPEFRGIARDKATTMGHIQRHHLADAHVVIPSPDKMKDFDAKINPIFSKIKHNLPQIRTLTRLRDTLLPKLMSGEVRVKNAERFVETTS